MVLHLSVILFTEGRRCHDVTSCYGQHHPSLTATLSLDSNTPLDSTHLQTAPTTLDNSHTPRTEPAGQHQYPVNNASYWNFFLCRKDILVSGLILGQTLKIQFISQKLKHVLFCVQISAVSHKLVHALRSAFHRLQRKVMFS